MRYVVNRLFNGSVPMWTYYSCIRKITMALSDAVAPSSMNQVLLVTMLWAGINVALSVYLASPIFRWEVLIGTAILGVWTLWAVQYRLAKFAQKQKR